MIRRLHTRTRADRFKNDVRSSRRHYARYVYLLLVFALFAYLAKLLVGPMLWLEADGVVSSERVVVAFPYDAEIVNVAVRPGQTVVKGQKLATVRSAQVTESIGTLTARYAETAAREAEIQIRVEVANAVIARANERLQEAEVNFKRINATRSSGFISDAFISNAVRERYMALQEKASREAERKTSVEQLVNLRKAQDEARAALDEIRTHYNNGRVVAPADGVVGQQVARRGDVLKPGQNLAEIHVGGKFVLAYLESGTLYEVKKQDRVEVAYGFAASTGTVVEVLPISMQLPGEFQTTFRPAARGQVAQIAIDDETTFPLSAKVRVKAATLFAGHEEWVRARIQEWAEKGQRTVEAALRW